MNNEQLDRIKDEVAAGHMDIGMKWHELTFSVRNSLFDEVCERHARACIEAHENKIQDLELRENHRISSIHYLIEQIKTIIKQVPSVGNPGLIAEINGELECWVSLKEYLNGRGLYTREQVIAAIEASLKEAAKNATIRYHKSESGIVIDHWISKSSITNEKNIKLL